MHNNKCVLLFTHLLELFAGEDAAVPMLRIAGQYDGTGIY
jgi:hypothetical protein